LRRAIYDGVRRANAGAFDVTTGGAWCDTTQIAHGPELALSVA
jgi:hypothetical protein